MSNSHVDSGKSILCGRLLSESDMISGKVLEKAAEDAEELGNKSLSLAYIMDKSMEERSSGTSMH